LAKLSHESGTALITLCRDGSIRCLTTTSLSFSSGQLSRSATGSRQSCQRRPPRPVRHRR
jgi:hypothetical protein